jgi:hypothetical protein
MFLLVSVYLMTPSAAQMLYSASNGKIIRTQQIRKDSEVAAVRSKVYTPRSARKA